MDESYISKIATELLTPSEETLRSIAENLNADPLTASLAKSPGNGVKGIADSKMPEFFTLIEYSMTMMISKTNQYLTKGYQTEEDEQSMVGITIWNNTSEPVKKGFYTECSLRISLKMEQLQFAFWKMP